MAKLRKPDQGLIFASCIFNSNHYTIEELVATWTSRYGSPKVDYPSFNPSLEYYSKEMGEGLKRVILICDEPKEREELILGKLWADSVERKTSKNQKRIVNIDIGIILKEQVLLSTSKPYSHRIYLNQGVWAELTYIYENKSYRFLPWTYPDYQCPEKLECFNSLRKGLF